MVNPQGYGTSTILLVEDDDGTAELERRALSRTGRSVRIASSVRDALALLAAEPFQAVLLDYHLPDGDPWPVVEAARALSPRVPVILVTAAGSELVAAEAIHRGVSEYVKKGDGFWERLPTVVDRAEHLAKAEERLRRSDAFFRLISENLSDMISTADGQGTLTYVSPACRKVLGYEPEELVGRCGRDLAHIEDRAVAIPGRSRGSVGHLHSTFRCRRKDGTHIWLEVNAYALPDSSGSASEIVAISRDVTARKRAEESLATEQARLAEAQAIAHVGSWDWDILTNVVTWSAEMYRIYGIRAEELAPSYEGFLSRVHPLDRERVHRTVLDAYRDKAGFEFEHRILRPDGEVRLLRAVGRVDVNQDGVPVRMAGVGQDVTEQRKLERALADRAAELTRSNTELEQFAYAASHDLRAPLRAMTTLLDWVVDDGDNRLTAQSRDYISLIQSRAARLDRLLTDILEFSRAGRTGSTPEPVDVGELLSDVLATAHRPPTFTIEVRGPMPQIVACRLPLKRVFMNLIDNAVKHHDGPAGVVVISAEEGGDAVVFRVSDDGPGIPSEHRDRVFRMFETLKPRDVVEGSGVGLALVKKLVDLNGGEICIEGHGARGATFRFTWPRAKDVDSSVGRD